MNSRIGFAIGFGLLSLVLVGAQAQQAPTSVEELEKLEKESSMVETVAGASVYKMPLISKINVRNMQLFPHYKPRRKESGWTHAYIEFATPTTARIWVEEIPPRSFKLIGRRDTGMYVFLGVTGKGYTEFRDDPLKPGTGIVWDSGDRFYMPFGAWYGHANPFDQPARILVFAHHLGEDMDNPFLGRTRTVPEQIFPGERRDPVPEDTVIEIGNWQATLAQVQKRAESNKTMDMERRGPAATLVFKVGLGDALNPFKQELPSHHKKLRAKTGWKGVHIDPGPEMGHRAHFTNLQEIPPRSQEIGHKHGGGIIFLGVKGRGYTALRATTDSPEARIPWGEWDLFQLPWLTAAGTWHSHANPYDDQPARFMGESISMDDDGLLNAKAGNVVHFAADGVGFGAPDKIFKEKADAPE
ncbi:MAG: hypothetical protein HY315_10270 [Acidobacteria bacterium]|nr:hypothetical protein [Acidobacteriota bacterium]